MLTKQEYKKKTKYLLDNFPSVNWKNHEERWLYHRQAIKWLKELNPETILEIGSLGIKLREDSKVLDNGSWDKIKYDIDYRQDVRDIDTPDFDCIVALRVLHHIKEFDEVVEKLQNKCKYLIIALPKEHKAPPYKEKKTFKSTTIYLCT